MKGKIAVFRNGEGGWCEHPFKMPACPKKPVCRACVKFKSDASYLPVYDKDIVNYQELYNRALEMGLTAKASEYKKDLDIAKKISFLHLDRLPGIKQTKIDALLYLKFLAFTMFNYLRLQLGGAYALVLLSRREFRRNAGQRSKSRRRCGYGGAVTGGLAGVYWGFENIPERWLVKFSPIQAEKLERIAEAYRKVTIL